MNRNKVLTILDNFDFRDFEFVKGCGNSLPLILPCKKFPKEFTYKSEKTFNNFVEPCKTGENSEKCIVNILKLFDFEYVYISKALSVLDVDYMVDVACRKDDLWYCFQVKSSRQDCEKKLNYMGDTKPIHIIYEHKSRKTIFAELQYLFKLLDIGLKVNVESIKQEYIPIIKELKSISLQKELAKFEILKPGMTKSLHTLFTVGILNYTNETYHIGRTL